MLIPITTGWISEVGFTLRPSLPLRNCVLRVSCFGHHVGPFEGGAECI